MTGKGSFTRLPQNRLKILLLVYGAWIMVVFLLGAWWGYLVNKQASRIAELETQVGISSNVVELEWVKTQRMLYWESSVFFLFLLGSMVLFFWLYWRDLKRARSIQAFFASLTHELKTPLTSIRLQAEAIADGTAAPDPKQKELVGRLLEDSSRLETQVERALELARLEGGGPLYVQPVNLRLVVDRMVKSSLPWNDDKVKVENRLSNFEIQADVGALQVILRNLLENSVRHSGRDSVVVSFDAEKAGSEVAFVVRDNGTGFKGDTRGLGKLFNKGPASQGAGVGLYLIGALMEKMNGRAVFNGGSGFEARLYFQGARHDG